MRRGFYIPVLGSLGIKPSFWSCAHSFVEETCIRVLCRACCYVIVHLSTQTACALQFLNERNISHLDLKPQNILLSGSVLKLAGDLTHSGKQ